MTATGDESKGAGRLAEAAGAEWVVREVLPILIEKIDPETVVVFDPPDRPADAEARPPGLLVVARSFRGEPVPSRVARLKALLAAASPVRPLCLTPEEYLASARVPGPVVAAARSGKRIL